MQAKRHITTDAAWLEWKRVCAADLCSGETEAMLRAFGSAKFSALLAKHAPHISHAERPVNVAEANDAWHLLETYVRLENNRAGKRYKDWLFSRAVEAPDCRLDALEGGAVVLMREVVREFLRREHAPAFMTSLDKPLVRSGYAPLSLSDLLPDRVNPQSIMTEKEWMELAKRHANEFFPRLSSRERIVLWARNRGFALNDPRIVKWTKTSDWLLYKVYGNVIEQLGRWIKKMYPDESPAAMIHLSCMMLDALGEIIAGHIFKEKRAARFFRSV